MGIWFIALFSMIAAISQWWCLCWCIHAMPFGGRYPNLKRTLNEDESVPNFISQNESTKAELSNLSYPLIKQDLKL